MDVDEYLAVEIGKFRTQLECRDAAKAAGQPRQQFGTGVRGAAFQATLFSPGGIAQRAPTTPWPIIGNAPQCSPTYEVVVAGVTFCPGWGALISDPNGTWHFTGSEVSGYTMVETPPAGLFYSFICATPDPMVPGDMGQLFLEIQGPVFDGITPPTPGGVSGATTLFVGTVPFSTSYPVTNPNTLVCGPDPGGGWDVAIGGSADITG